MDDSNQDTVRSVAELISRDEAEVEVFDDRAKIDVEHELVRRGFPAVDRQDSQAPPSILRGDSTEEKVKPKMVWTRTLINEVVMVCVLAAIIITATTIIYHFYQDYLYRIELGKRIYFGEDSRIIDVKNIHQEDVLHGVLGRNIPELHLPYDCSNEEEKAREICMLWKEEALLNISYYEAEDYNVNCYNIEWTTLSKVILPKDCFQLAGGSWYGGPMMSDQTYPIDQREPFAKRAVVPGYAFNRDTFGPVVERYWLSSHGVAIFADDATPLHISMNASADVEQFCLYADFDNSPFLKRDQDELPKLNYTICVGENVTNVDKYVFHTFGKPPGRLPNEEDILTRPVWSTWANLHSDQLTQDNVLEMASYINVRALPHSLFMINHGWQSAPGNYEFDPSKFPDPGSMITSLRSQGFKVGLTVQPLVNSDSSNFHQAVSTDTCVYDQSGNVPGLVKWWSGQMTDIWMEGYAGNVDMHNEGQNFLRSKLAALSSQFGELHFHFEGGETDVLPFRAKYHGEYDNPSVYCRDLSEFGASLGNGLNIQVRCAHGAHQTPVIVRFSELDSDWAGLQSVIPMVLNTGIIGHPYIMPDPIYGNNYNARSDKELYIRWLELSTFMPVMQFSILPDKFDSQTEQIAQTYTQLRENTIGPLIVQLAQESATSMMPIVRAMWFHYNDENVFTINDQFMLGPDMLVAPVVTASTYSREVYFPEGSWQEQNTNRQYNGPGRESIQVPIDKILYFKRGNSNVEK